MKRPTEESPTEQMPLTDRALPPIHLIILAGGQGTRARRRDSAAPKQFRTVGGLMLFVWSARELLRVPEVASLTVAVPEPWQVVARKELEAARLERPCLLAEAGSSRTASTWQATAALQEMHAPRAGDLVAVHDAARPFASHHLLVRLAAAAAQHGAAVPGVEVRDTVVQIVPDGPRAEFASARYLQRSTLQAVQTPQVFRWREFVAAHRWSHETGGTFTDDGGLLAVRGMVPAVVMGEAENWKITTESDWALAEAVLRGRADLP